MSGLRIRLRKTSTPYISRAATMTKSFENTGSTPLELLVVGVVRDVNRKFDVVVPPARGGRGN